MIDKTRDEYVTETWLDFSVPPPPKSEIKDVEDALNRFTAGLVVSVSYWQSTGSISSMGTHQDTPDGYDFPRVDTISELAEKPNWRKVAEVSREEHFHYNTGAPGTLADCMEELTALVPEIANKHDEVMAKIKAYVHGEKRSTYRRLDAPYMKFKAYPGKTWLSKFLFKKGYVEAKQIEEKQKWIDGIMELKIKTHGPESWLNYDACLAWVKKYGQPRKKSDVKNS